jgi:hypothetical protein
MRQPENIRILSLKIIILMGKARSSAEDLLIAYGTIKSQGLEANFD